VKATKEAWLLPHFHIQYVESGNVSAIGEAASGEKNQGIMWFVVAAILLLAGFATGFPFPYVIVLLFLGVLGIFIILHVFYHKNHNGNNEGDFF
jgi:type III secretory pathway component EscV